MLVAGSDDGAYRISGLDGVDEPTVEKVLDAGRVFRVRQFDAVEGLFAASEAGLYHSLDGTDWTALGVPQEGVYAVCASPSGERLYAGTRPAHVYVASLPSSDVSPSDGIAKAGDPEWRELDSFRDLASREWRKTRHDDVAQVRSLGTHRGAPDRVVAGVEVGGVHVSDDGGETWDERNGGVNDDVHHLHVVNAEEYVAATGFGLFRTADAGRTWSRLDRGVDQRYFRGSFSHDGVVYAAAAHGPSSTWDEETDHALFEWREGDGLEEVESPTPDELAIGWYAVDGDVLAATHRGTLLRRGDGGGGGDDGWTEIGRVPVPGEVRGRYLPLAWVDG